MTKLCGWVLTLALLPLGAAAEALRLVADHWPPFNDRTLPNNGLAADLATTALSRAGYTSSYAETPWLRAMGGFLQGEYDVLVDTWYTAERTGFGQFSQPYLTNHIRLLQRKGADIKFQQLADLGPYRIAVARGYIYSEKLAQATWLHTVNISSFEAGAAMLEAGRVDLMVVDEWSARYHLARGPREHRDGLEFVPMPLGTNGLRILVSHRHPNYQAIVDGFDTAIEAMRADGTYAQIFRRHGFAAQ